MLSLNVIIHFISVDVFRSREGGLEACGVVDLTSLKAVSDIKFCFIWGSWKQAVK